MRICLISSSFYPAIKYGGPISATWDLSNKLTNHNFKVYVSTTNANFSSRLNVLRNQYIKINKNLFIKYYHEELINRFSFNFLFKVWSDIKKSDIVYIQYLFHYTVIISLFYSILQKKRVIICARGSFSDYTFNHSLTFIKYIWIYLFIYPFSRYITWQACSYIEKKTY